MVAYRLPDNMVLYPQDRQELLLIRAQISPPEMKAGDPMCALTNEMKKEFTDILSELYLLDADGKIISKNQATGKTVAEHYGKIDISSLKIIGPEQAMFEEFADIRDGPNPAMSMDGLSKALHEMHVDKSGDDLMTAFKMTDLNGDGKIDLDEFLFAVKIRHGDGFEKGQYFVTWTSEEQITPKQEQEIPLLLKDMTHPLSGTVEEVVMFGRTASAMSHLSFKGKSLETGQMINRIPSTNSSSFNRIESSQSSLSFNRIASDQSLGGIVEEGAAPKENEEATGETN